MTSVQFAVAAHIMAALGSFHGEQDPDRERERKPDLRSKVALQTLESRAGRDDGAIEVRSGVQSVR